MAVFPARCRFAGSTRAGPALSGLSRSGPKFYPGVYMYSNKERSVMAGVRRAVRLAAVFALGVCARDFDGKQALEFTRRAVQFGPRPPGSAGSRKLQAYILSQLKLWKCEVTQDD